MPSYRKEVYQLKRNDTKAAVELWHKLENNGELDPDVEQMIYMLQDDQDKLHKALAKSNKPSK